MNLSHSQMTLETLQFVPFNSGEIPEHGPASPMSDPQEQRLVLPFGVMEGMLTPLPTQIEHNSNTKGISMETSGSIYQTVTDGNDREGDRED